MNSIQLVLVICLTACAVGANNYKHFLQTLLEKLESNQLKRSEKPVNEHIPEIVSVPISGSGFPPSPVHYPGYDVPMNMTELHQYGNWKQNMTFPGGDFLFKILREYSHWVPQESELVDHMDFSMADWSFLTNDMTYVVTTIYNAEFAALYYTRAIVRFVLTKRMACPTAVYDRIIANSIPNMLNQTSSSMVTQEASLEARIRTVLVHFSPLAPYYINWEPEHMASDVTRLIHNVILNDTLEYLMYSTYNDVSRLSHGVFERLSRFFSHYVYRSPSKLATFPSVMRDLFTTYPVQCHSPEVMFNTHTTATWALFDSLENAELCRRIPLFIQNHLPFAVGMSDTTDPVLTDLCSYLSTYITSMRTSIVQFQDRFMTGPNEFLEFIRPSMSSTDFEILDHITLGFVQRNAPRELNTIDHIIQGFAQRNDTHIQFIPTELVLQNERMDIDFWQSFLSSPEVFPSEIRDMITNWLDMKMARLENYNSYIV